MADGPAELHDVPGPLHVLADRPHLAERHALQGLAAQRSADGVEVDADAQVVRAEGVHLAGREGARRRRRRAVEVAQDVTLGQQREAARRQHAAGRAGQPRILCERPEQRRQPALPVGRRPLRQVDQRVAVGERRQQVARAPVVEVLRRDADDAGAAGHERVDAAVRRAGVDGHELDAAVRLLGQDGVEQRLEPRPAVLDRQADRDERAAGAEHVRAPRCDRLRLRRGLALLQARAGRQGRDGAAAVLVQLDGEGDVVAQRAPDLARALGQQPLQLDRVLVGVDERDLGRHPQRERVVRRVADLEQPVRDVVVELVAAHRLAPGGVPQRLVVLVEAAPAGDRLQVVEDARGAVADAASGRAEPQAEVDVLVAVAEALVEAAQAVEVRAPDEQAGAGHGLEGAGAVDRRVVAGEAAVHVARDAVEADDDARVLDGAVGVEQLRAGHRGVGVRVQLGHQLVEPRRAGHDVVVEEAEQLGLGGAGAVVAGGREALRLRVAHVADGVAVAAQELVGGAAVRRGVVDHDQLGRRRARLAQQGVDALAGQRRAAVHRDDDGAARGRAHQRRSSRPARAAARRPMPFRRQ